MQTCCLDDWLDEVWGIWEASGLHYKDLKGPDPSDHSDHLMATLVPGLIMVRHLMTYTLTSWSTTCRPLWDFPLFYVPMHCLLIVLLMRTSYCFMVTMPTPCSSYGFSIVLIVLSLFHIRTPLLSYCGYASFPFRLLF